MADSSEFLIRLIVTAQNKVGGVMQKVAEDVDRVTGAQERNTRTQKKLGDQVEETKNRFASFSDEVHKGGVELEDTAKTMRQFGSEFDRLAKRAPAGSDLARSLIESAREARRAAAVAVEEQRKVTNAQAVETAKRIGQSKEEAKEVSKSAETIAEARRKAAVEDEKLAGAERLNQLKREQAQRALQTEIEETMARYDLFDLRVQRGEETSVRAAAGYRQFASEIGSLQRQFDAGSDSALELGEKVEEARQRSQDFTNTAQRMREQADDTHNSLLRLFGVDPGKMDRITQSIAEFERTAGKSRFAIAGVSSGLRGLIVVTVIAFFQQLVGVAVALGGTLVALAASAVQAGIALAGMATAAAAQAVPAIALLGAAWGRVGAVFDTVKQALKAQTQSAYDNAQAADRQRSAARGVESAQDGLEKAHRRVTDATDALTKARGDAKRQIEDLIEAERRAELQALAANEAQISAQRSLRRAIRSGDIDAQAGAELDLMNANLGVDTSGRGLNRAREDANRARRGVEAMEGVIAATRALEDAKEGVEDAKNALSDAGEAATQANEQLSATQRNLAILLDQLTPAERRLYEVSLRISTAYRDLWINGVLTPIVDAFTFGAERVYALMTDPRVLGAATDLSEALQGEMQKFFDFMTNDENVAFAEFLTDELEENLPVVESILEHIFSLLRNIAIAAAPALSDFLDYLNEIFGNADDATSGNGGISRLERFFSKGEEYAESWFNFFGAIGNVIGALIGAGAEEGQTSLDSATESINRAADYIDEHRDDVRQFFADAREATGYVLHAVGEIAVALFGLFHSDQVKVFTQAFEEFLLPALEDVFKAIGAVTMAFLAFASTGPGSAVMQLVVTALLLTKVFRPIVTLFARLFVFAGQLAGSTRLVNGGLAVLRVIAGPVGAALAAVAAILFLLVDRFDSLGDVLKTIGIAIGVAAGAGILARIMGLGGAFDGVLTKVLRLIRELPILKGLMRGLGGGAAAGAAGAGGAVLADQIIDFDKVDADGKTKSRGGRLGKLFGSGFLNSAKGFLKTSAFFSVGIGAVTGILSGFKHDSVRAGFQDFFHSLSFGLIESFEESAEKAGKRASKKLKESLDSVLPKGPKSDGSAISLDDLFGRQTTRVPTTAGERAAEFSRGRPGRDGVSQFRDQLTQAGKDIAILREKYGADFDGFLNGLRDYVSRFRAAVAEGDALGMDSLYTQIKSFAKDAPPELKTALEKMVAEAKVQRDRLMGVFDKKAMVSAIVGNFGLALQAPKADIEKLTGDLIKSMEDLPPAGQRQARRLAIEMANGLREKGVLTKQQADKIKDDVGDAFKKMRKDNRERAAKLAEDTATAMGAVSNVVSIQMSGMVRNVNSVLKALGFGNIKLPKIDSAKEAGKGAGQVAALLGGLLGGGKAEGGWIGMAGERGADMVHALLGRGEAVLNWGHQRVVEPAMRAYYGFGLDDMFSKYRGEHAGYAQGGYVQGAQKPDGPGSGPIRSLAGQLFRRGFSATSGGEYRGTGTLHDQQKALDWGDSVNNLRRLAQVLWPLRRSITELFMPTYVPHGGLYRNGVRFQDGALQADHQDHIHTGITAVIGKLTRRMRNMLGDFDRLKAPKVPGSGPLSQIAEGLLERVARAGNRRMERAAGRPGTPGGDFQGNILSVARRAAGVARVPWNGSLVRALLGKESSGGKNVGPSGPLSATGPFQVIPSTFAAYAMRGHKNIRNVYDNALAAFAYIRSRYGTMPELARRTGLLTPAYKGYRGGGFVGGAIRRFAGGRPGFVQRDIEPTVGNLAGEARRARRVLSRLPDPTSGRSKFSRSLLELAGDNGVLDQLQDALEAMVTKLSGALLRATYKITSTGNVIRKLGDVKVADRELKNLRRAYGGLVDERGIISHQLRDINKRLTVAQRDIAVTRAQGGTVTDEQKKTVAYLKGYGRNIAKRLGEVNDSIAQNLQDTYEAVENSIQARVDRADRKAQRGLNLADLMDRVRSFIGGSALGLTNRTAAGNRAGILNTQADDLQKAADRAKGAGHMDTYNEIINQIADLRLTALEIVSQGIADDAAEVQRQAERRMGMVELGDRLAGLRDAAGDKAGAFAMRGQGLASRGGIISDEISRLRGLAGEATSIGSLALAEDLNDQIAELTVQLEENAAAIKENTVQARQAQIDAITGRGSFLTGVYGGLQGLVQAVGAVTGVIDINTQGQLIQQVISTLQGTGGALAQQLFEAFGIDIRGMGVQQLVATLQGLNYDGIEANFTDSEQAQFENLINAIIENASAVYQNTDQLNQLNNPTAQAWSSTAWQWFRNAIFNGAGGLLSQYQVPSLASGADIISDGMVHVHAGEKVVAANVARGSGQGDVFAPTIENHEKTVDMDEETLANRLMFMWKDRPKG